MKLFLHVADWHVASTVYSSRVQFSSLRCAWKYCTQVNDLTWIGWCWYQIGSICSVQHQWCLCLLENTAVNLISLQIIPIECVGVSCILANVSEHETVLFILWVWLFKSELTKRKTHHLIPQAKYWSYSAHVELCSHSYLLQPQCVIVPVFSFFFFFTTFTEFQWLWEIAVRSLLPSLVISCQDTPVLNHCCCFHFTNCDWTCSRFWLIFTPLKMLLWAKCHPEMYLYVSLFHKRFVLVWFLYTSPPRAFLLLLLSLQKQN